MLANRKRLLQMGFKHRRCYSEPCATIGIGAVCIFPDGSTEVFGGEVPKAVLGVWREGGKTHVIGLVELYACVVSHIGRRGFHRGELSCLLTTGLPWMSSLKGRPCRKTGGSFYFCWKILTRITFCFGWPGFHPVATLLIIRVGVTC